MFKKALLLAAFLVGSWATVDSVSAADTYVRGYYCGNSTYVMLRCSTALPTPRNCWHLWDCLNDAVTTAARAATNGDLSEKISVALKDQLLTLDSRFPRDHVAYVGRQYLEFLHDEDRPA